MVGADMLIEQRLCVVGGAPELFALTVEGGDGSSTR